MGKDGELVRAPGREHVFTCDYESEAFQEH